MPPVAQQPNVPESQTSVPQPNPQPYIPKGDQNQTIIQDQIVPKSSILKTILVVVWVLVGVIAVAAAGYYAYSSPFVRELVSSQIGELNQNALDMEGTETPDTSLSNGGLPSDVTIELAETPETIFAYGKEVGCDKERTDTRVSAFRRDDGNIAFFASNSQNYAYSGDTLDTVKQDPDCRRIFVAPPKSENPGDFHGKMWLKGAVETLEGDIVGFIHNEYHGEDFDPECEAALKKAKSDSSTDGLDPCWYASSLIALSHDGGVTFDTNSTRAFATVPYTYKKLEGEIGYRSPIMLSHREGDITPYMYMFFSTSNNKAMSEKIVTKSGAQGTCLMRGTNTDPATWLAWGGNDFDVTIVNPYATNVTNLDAHKCEPVFEFGIGAIKYITSKKTYIALGTDAGKVVYATSRDLVHWSEPKVLMTFIHHEGWKEGDPAPTAYFSLLDPTSPSRSFETLEDRPYLYYVEYTGVPKGDENNAARNLLRVPITIQ